MVLQQDMGEALDVPDSKGRYSLDYIFTVLFQDLIFSGLFLPGIRQSILPPLPRC